ncbi:sirohydrochlorin cobaltochelatase [Clostridium sp.]|uniref:sirohydrochlorin cobaltochelatase n=1 Tax=Clostridium sp. TaxID=1506 RepID=UPI0025BAF938|nr:sirohydrochlorin cobaltochelatase [Clostridium sp.]MBS4958468.1 sirohydrochlorin cobaltochelatase [Clostridium sp.]MDU4884768.1 sirohydrochlorin cobaltochelatase [Clostridium celatum]MDU7077950.1 sirohydrochlorin cobaltochelatase [Clostridium celatum]
MKKAILVVSFGTSYLDTLEKTIEKAEKQIRDKFSEYDIYRAFTSHMIIKKLKEKYEIFVDTPEEILEKLYEAGYEEVIMQPLHMIPGEEFIYINKIAEVFKEKFEVLKVGRPIFYYQGIEELPQDYSLFIEATKELYEENNAVVLMGHGTAHPSNSVYGCLQAVFEDEGYENVFVTTVEGYPNFENVISRLKRKNISEVTIAPLMVVAGDHARNDMASDDEDSLKSVLEAEGIKVNVHLKGLGENEKFNELYINRIDDLINNRYVGVGQTKKGHRIKVKN